MRQAALKFPSVTFTFGSQWLQGALETPLDLGVGKSTNSTQISLKYARMKQGGPHGRVVKDTNL